APLSRSWYGWSVPGAISGVPVFPRAPAGSSGVPSSIWSCPPTCCPTRSIWTTSVSCCSLCAPCAAPSARVRLRRRPGGPSAGPPMTTLRKVTNHPSDSDKSLEAKRSRRTRQRRTGGPAWSAQHRRGRDDATVRAQLRPSGGGVGGRHSVFVRLRTAVERSRRRTDRRLRPRVVAGGGDHDIHGGLQDPLRRLT